MHGFLIDLDGTLYKGNEAIPGAKEFVELLNENGLPYLLVTNNSSRSPEHVAGHLNGMGIEIDPGRVYTTAMASAQYLLEHGSGKRVFCIGEEGLLNALQEAGFELTDKEPDYVVQGIDRQLTYDKLASAVKHLLGGARYILTNPDHLLPSDGGLIPGAGSIGALIRTASGANPVVIGKPSPVIMNYALARLELQAKDTWVIGDNTATDIGGGIAAGCRTALVLTGLATETNVQDQISKSGNEPDLICRDLPHLWNSLMK